MAHIRRNTLAALTLVAGAIWSLPMQPGRDSSPLEPVAYSATDVAEFRISSGRAALTITGHTRSTQHERRLAEATRKHFPAREIQQEYHPLGVAPEWWEEATIGLVDLLAGLESPDAYLSQDTLRIRAVIYGESDIDEQLQIFLRRLPSSTRLDNQFAVVDKNTTVAAYCDQQYASHTTGPIAFEESGTVLRVSAYPVLDRVIALADACRSSMLTITGHTDSSGSELLNQKLSLARAQAVATYLDSRGIAADRLVTIGAGSSSPIASNATRYGRSKNRRIEIDFEPTR